MAVREYARPQLRLSSMRLAIIVLFVLGPATQASAEPKDVLESQGEITINWTRGLLIVRAAASADLRAPTANIARVKAERSADELAQRKLVTAAKALPAAGGSVGDLIKGDAKTRWSKLGRDVVALETIYNSDGSAIVRRGLPIEAVRRALRGPDPAPAVPQARPLVIDARKLAIKPAIGITAVSGSERYAPPVLFVRAAPKEATALLARSFDSGALELASKDEAAVRGARNAGAVLFVLIK